MIWKCQLLLIVYLMLAFFYETKAQTIQLPQVAKFKMGDNPNWADQFFNDQDWENKKLGEGVYFNNKTDNYVWYRLKVVIPSSIKALAEHSKAVQLTLGKIDDIDQTYFNGKLLGQTGSFPPNYESKSQIKRSYSIPVAAVKWDQENTIAIRVFSPDSWLGMSEGPYQLKAAQWSDYISINQKIEKISNNSFSSKLHFKNNGKFSFEGTILYQVLDGNKKQVFSESKKVLVRPNIGDDQEIVFTNFKSTKEKIVTIVYSVKENSSTASVHSETIYLLDNTLTLSVAAAPKPVINNKIANAYTAINFSQQKLQGYLGTRINQNLVQRLLKVDEPGILDGYLERPGHHPWAGEHVGKYLEAASNAWQYSGDPKLKMQMDQIMLQLINSQLGTGYLGTYEPSEYWTSWDVWSHKYNLYGLLAYYEKTGYQPALNACKKIGDLLCTTFGTKPNQRDIILAGTHMGMASTSVLDPMVELYKFTGDKKYLNFCYYLVSAWEQKHGPKIISALLETGKVTHVGNAKAYEMLSNFVGLANLYQVTGDSKFLKPILIAWQDIVNNRLYITGTTSSKEYFQEDQVLPASKDDNMGEGCVTTTWIQFNYRLFSFTGDLKYLAQIEKSVYNQLLAAENPQSGCVSYYTSLMDAKPYNCEITCCTSSVPRGIALIPYFSIGHLKSIPTVLLYEPGLYKDIYIGSNKIPINYSLKVESNFPESGEFNITFNSSSNKDSLPLAFRVPDWCNSFVIKVGSQEFSETKDQCVIIKRKWSDGEKISIRFNMPLKVIQGGKTYTGLTALQRGPQVLALDESLNQNVGKTKTETWALDASVTSKSELLPKQWIGKQVYAFSLLNKNQLVLVPFADASQTGGSIKVWMPLKPIK